MINDKTKKSVIYILIITGHLLMGTLIINNWLLTPKIIDVYADTSNTSIPEQELDKEVEDIGGDEAESETTAEEHSPQYSREDIAALIVDVFGYNETGRIALAIAQCESGLKPKSINNSNWLWGGKGVDHGLFQINDYYHSDKFDNVEQLYDPEFNIRLARKIYDKSGFWAWSCFKSGGYLQKL